jgi:hypothetical protein
VTQGPVQAMVFAVPGGVGTNMGSTQTTITAEEAYLVAGLGPLKAMVAPWSDPTVFFGRTATKGTQISIGANIGVASAKKKPADFLVRAHRLSPSIHSYWPDSTPSVFDKQNVRDGHYPLWSYVQYAAPQAAGGGALNPNAQTIIDMLSGKTVTTNPVFNPIDLVITNGLVPACAMKVQRSVEGGDMTPASVAQPCGCYFDFKTKGSTTCTACTDNSTCGTGMCRYGYCEAK